MTLLKNWEGNIVRLRGSFEAITSSQVFALTFSLSLIFFLKKTSSWCSDNWQPEAGARCDVSIWIGFVRLLCKACLDLHISSHVKTTSEPPPSPLLSRCNRLNPAACGDGRLTTGNVTKQGWTNTLVSMSFPYSCKEPSFLLPCVLSTTLPHLLMFIEIDLQKSNV